MKVFANYDTCVASGSCGHIAPRVFQNLEDHGGFVSVRIEYPPEAEWPAVRRAKRLCPSGTIFLTEDQGSEKNAAPGSHPGKTSAETDLWPPQQTTRRRRRDRRLGSQPEKETRR